MTNREILKKLRGVQIEVPDSQLEAFIAQYDESGWPKAKYLVQCERAGDGFLKFDCRWCGGVHHHGEGEGWRMSHCEKCYHQYYLVEPKE